MDKQRWQQIQRIFKHIADKSPSHRTDYLDMVCEDDAALRSEILELLSAHDKIDEHDSSPWIDSIQDLANSLHRPQRVGEYRILEELGRGGMGVVYLAEHSNHGRVALKLLPRFESSEVQQRFQLEAHILEKLNHPNLCQYHEIFTTDEYTVIAMEHFDAIGLDQRLKQGALGYEQSIKILLQLSEVLALAHNLKLTHRDIKPSNILLTENDQIKLIDFGIAKFADTRLTATGQILGTPAYMSPEQWRGEAIDYRTDLWSLGILLFELLSGVTPFAAEDRFEVANRVLTQGPARLPSSSRDGKPLNKLQAIVDQLLRKQVEQRQISCAELALQLNEALKS